jgi:ribonuclease HI
MWQHFPRATNNMIELRAVTEALSYLPPGMVVWVSRHEFTRGNAMAGRTRRREVSPMLPSDVNLIRPLHVRLELCVLG